LRDLRAVCRLLTSFGLLLLSPFLSLLLLLLAPACLGSFKSDLVLVVCPHPVGILDLEKEIGTWKVVDVPVSLVSLPRMVMGVK
jgi:hypothetical protein